MLSLSTVLLFSIASIMLAITPGPDMLYIATRSISQGRSAGVFSALGVHAGLFVHTLAAALGLSAIIAASELAFDIVRYAGAAYLIYLGVKMLMSKSEALEVKVEDHRRLRNIFYQGMITNVSNPKVILFFLAFLPQFVDPTQGHVPMQLFMLGCLMILVTIPVDLAVGLLGGTVGKVIKNSKTAQSVSKWFTGSIFVVMGVTTAILTDRKG